MTEQNRRVDDHRLELILNKLQEAEDKASMVKSDLRVSEEKYDSQLEAHKVYCDTEFKRLDLILKPIKRGFDIVDTPARWIGWTIVATLGGALVWLGNHLMAWLSKHFGQ